MIANTDNMVASRIFDTGVVTVAIVRYSNPRKSAGARGKNGIWIERARI
jgi:hypothetical protein